MCLDGLSVFIIYALVGVVVTLCAYLLSRKRPLEAAEDVIAVGFLRPVFKYGIALCAGIVFGSLFYELFWDVLPRGMFSMLLFILIFAALGYYAAEMLLKKSARVLRKGFRGLLVLLAVITISMVAMEWDIFGFERNIPEAGEIQSVRILETNSTIDDPEYIETMLLLHHALLEHKGELEREYYRYNNVRYATTEWVEDGYGNSQQLSLWSYMNFSY